MVNSKGISLGQPPTTAREIMAMDADPRLEWVRRFKEHLDPDNPGDFALGVRFYADFLRTVVGEAVHEPRHDAPATAAMRALQGSGSSESDARAERVRAFLASVPGSGGDADLATNALLRTVLGIELERARGRGEEVVSPGAGSAESRFRLALQSVELGRGRIAPEAVRVLYNATDHRMSVSMAPTGWAYGERLQAWVDSAWPKSLAAKILQSLAGLRPIKRFRLRHAIERIARQNGANFRSWNFPGARYYGSLVPPDKNACRMITLELLDLAEQNGAAFFIWDERITAANVLEPGTEFPTARSAE